MTKLIFPMLLLFNSIAISAADLLEINHWDLQAINASRIVYSKNISAADAKNNFYLSPLIDQQHVGFLHHDTLKPFIKHLSGELAGTPLYDHEGAYVFITTKDGWITKYNLQTGMPEIKVRVGLKTANSSLSDNARFLLVGNQQPADLVFLKPDDLSVVQIIPVRNLKGMLSPVTAVGNAGEQHGFIVIPEKFPHIWKISYLDPPPIGFGDGWNHDYRCLKDHMDKPLFPIKRLRIEQTLKNFFIDETNIYLLGSNNDGEGIIFDLDLSRIVGQLGSATIAADLIWETDEASELAVLHQDKTVLSFYSNASHLGQWKKVVDINVGSISTMAACPASDLIWLAGESGKIQLINKYSHSIEKTIMLAQQPIHQLSCTQDNKYILIETGDDEKSLLVYDILTQKPLGE